MSEQLTEEPAEIAIGQPSPIRVSWAPIPRVNLLPLEIIEGRTFRRTKVVLGAVVVGTLLIAGGATFLAERSVSHANDQLAASDAKVSVLQTQEKRYAAVPEVIAQVEAANTARTLAMGTDVLWYRYLTNLDDARPEGLELNSIALTMNGAALTQSSASANPLAPNGVGTITVGGKADRYSEISSWLEAVNKITGFSASALTGASDTDSGLTFNSSAVVDSDALSGRYEKKAG